jgi:hypothetical protein
LKKKLKGVVCPLAALQHWPRPGFSLKIDEQSCHPIKEAFLRYCKLDSLVMVMIFQA